MESVKKTQQKSAARLYVEKLDPALAAEIERSPHLAKALSDLVIARRFVVSQYGHDAYRKSLASAGVFLDNINPPKEIKEAMRKTIQAVSKTPDNTGTNEEIAAKIAEYSKEALKRQKTQNPSMLEKLRRSLGATQPTNPNSF